MWKVWMLNARRKSDVYSLLRPLLFSLDADKAHFVTLVLAEFKALHAGNAVRFGIGPLELVAWQERHGAVQKP